MSRQPWELEDDEIAEIEHDAHDVCSRCEGEGRLWADGLMHYYDPNRPTKACPNCDGTGRVVSGNEGRDVATAAQKRLVEYMAKNNSVSILLECNDGVKRQSLMLQPKVWEPVKTALEVH